MAVSLLVCDFLEISRWSKLGTWPLFIALPLSSNPRASRPRFARKASPNVPSSKLHPPEYERGNEPRVERCLELVDWSLLIRNSRYQVTIETLKSRCATVAASLQRRLSCIPSSHGLMPTYQPAMGQGNATTGVESRGTRVVPHGISIAIPCDVLFPSHSGNRWAHASPNGTHRTVRGEAVIRRRCCSRPSSFAGRHSRMADSQVLTDAENIFDWSSCSPCQGTTLIRVAKVEPMVAGTPSKLATKSCPGSPSGQPSGVLRSSAYISSLTRTYSKLQAIILGSLGTTQFHRTLLVSHWRHDAPTVLVRSWDQVQVGLNEVAAGVSR